MSEVLAGVIRGKTIELRDDPGLADGQEVRVVLLDRARDHAAKLGALAISAGALAHLDAAAWDDLDRIVAERQGWSYRDIGE